MCDEDSRSTTTTTNKQRLGEWGHPSSPGHSPGDLASDLIHFKKILGGGDPSPPLPSPMNPGQVPQCHQFNYTAQGQTGAQEIIRHTLKLLMEEDFSAAASVSLTHAMISASAMGLSDPANF